MNDSTTTIEQLKKQVRDFVTARNWQQYHTPKSLAMAIAIEAAELMEPFLWCENNATDVITKKRAHIEDELADIAITLMNFCQTNDIDLSKAIDRKITKIAKKYPIEKSYGKPDKYTDL